MSKLKLRYFDMHGGRAEATRIAMSIGGIDFEDDRIPFAEFAGVQEEMPYRAVPVLEIDGEAITQCNAHNRYVGRLADLYPKNPLAALHCDEAMDAVEDILTKVVATFSMPEEERRVAREVLTAGPLSRYLQTSEATLVAHGGEYFADNRLTIADLKVYVWIRSLSSGQLDYIPTDLVERVAPNLAEHRDRIHAEPGVAAYYAARE